MLRKLINYYVPLWDFLYILQLEEYDLGRYLKQIWPRLLKRNFEVRESLQYTGRMKVTFALSALLLVPLPSDYWLLWLCLVPITTPFAILLASAVVSIPVAMQKKRRLRRAAAYFIKEYPDTKVIAITGSFGKTTAKYLLQHVLQYDYRVAIIPDNLNTSLGIANYLLSGQVPKSTELLIVEMGAYTRGDITEAAQVTPPDYAVITIFGDQHMERFGSHANIVFGKSEIFTTHEQTQCYLPADSYRQVKEQQLSTDRLTAVSVPDGAKSTEYLVTKLAQDLGVSNESINSSLETFTPPNRRNNVFVRDGVVIIDNSYNLSPMVAEAMLSDAKEMASKANKKLVVLTGGIGEQGTESDSVNQKFGQLLNDYSIRVILTDSIYAAAVRTELSIPHKTVAKAFDVSEQPSDWLDGQTEVLLWLTEHSDLAYL